MSSHKIIGTNVKVDSKNNHNTGFFLNNPAREFVDKFYFKRMSLKEFISLYKLELKHNKIEKINLEGFSIGNDGLNNICEVQYKELRWLKELNLNGNNLSIITPLENTKFEKLEILKLSDNKISDFAGLQKLNYPELKLT